MGEGDNRRDSNDYGPSASQRRRRQRRSTGKELIHSFIHLFAHSLIHSFTHFSQFPPDIFKRPPLCFGHDADDKQELEHHHQGKKSKHRASPE